MTNPEYFAAEGVSNSMLGQLERSPMHLQSYLAGDQEQTRAMELGSDFHDVLLLDAKLDDIVVKPETYKDAKTGEVKKWNGNASVCRAWLKEQEAAGKRPVSIAEHDSIFGMREAVMRHPKLRLAIETGERERALFAPFTLGGTVMRKGKLDLIPRSCALIDFKTCQDASPEAFARVIGNRAYMRQAAYYLDLATENGYEHTDFLFVAVEKAPPYAVAIYYLSAEQIGFGRKRYIELLQLYMRCRDSNEWPGYDQEPHPIEIPGWFMKEAA